MELQDAIAAVDKVLTTGDNIFGNNCDKWSAAEHVLTAHGDERRAYAAHKQAVRAYRNEEWGAGLR